MNERGWLRELMKRELKSLGKGKAKVGFKVLRKAGRKPTIHNRVMFSMGLYSEIR